MTSLFLRMTVYLFIGLISSQVNCAALNPFRLSQDFPAPISLFDFLNVKNRENQVGNLKLSNSSTVPLQDPFVSFFGVKPLLSKVIRGEEPSYTPSLPSASRDTQFALSISKIIDEMAKMFKSTLTKENILSGLITENDDDKEDEEEEDEKNEKQSTQNLGQLTKPTFNSKPSSAIDLLIADMEEDAQSDCDEEKDEEDGSNSWLLSYPSASNSGLLTILSGLSVPKESSLPNAHLSTSDEDKEYDCDEDTEEGKKKEEESQSSPVANSESLPLSGNMNQVSASTIIASPSSGINIEEILNLNEDTNEDEDEKITDLLESLALSDILSEGSSALESAPSLSPGSIGIIAKEDVDQDEDKVDETTKNSGLSAPSNGLGAIAEDILSLTAPTSSTIISEEVLEFDDDKDKKDEEEDATTQSNIFSSTPATDNSGFLAIPQTISNAELSVINAAPVAIESYFNEDNIQNTIQSVAAPVAQSSPMTIPEPTIMSLVPPFYFVTSTTPAPKSNFFTGNECRDPSVPDGKHIPYPGDCNKFIHCDNYKAWVKNCGVGLHFNRFVQVCDWPASAGCI